MSDRHSPTRNEALAGLPIHERIRELREERQLPAYRLAEMAGISPSYLSLIESGEKVPSEEVAVAIATALGDDPDLYRGWSHAGGREGLVQLLDSLTSYVHYTSGPERDPAVALAKQAVDPGSVRDIDFERFLGSARATQEVHDGATASIEPSVFEDAVSPTSIAVPLFEEGADPVDDPAPVEILRLDRRLFPVGGAERPFAYRPGPDALSRAGKLIKPGELVVLSSRTGNLDPQSVHAVRFEGRVVLSRVLFKGNALLLLPPEGSSEFDIIEIDSRAELDFKIAGTVVLTVRDWGAREETPPRPDALLVEDGAHLPRLTRKLSDVSVQADADQDAAQMLDLEVRKAPGALAESRVMSSRARSWSLGRLLAGRGRKRPRTPRPYGRSYTLENDTLVRRVEWKDGYGWRPTQRPEDLRWIEAERGRRIRFELTRDDEVLYHLDMDSVEWRDALGDYGESPSWPRHGYITSITRMRDGEYTEEFKDRWAPFVKRA